jgi:hypothetical protein
MATPPQNLDGPVVDLLDPETWKRPAELAGYRREMGGGALGLLAVLGSATTKGRAALTRAWRRVMGTKPKIADLRFVQDDRRTFWSFAKLGSDDVSSIFGAWNVTNLSTLSVCLLRFRIRSEQSEHHVILSESHVDHVVIIRAGRMVQLDAHCIIRRKLGSAQQLFIADVFFTDNYGDEHRVRSVRFDYRGP